jgi:hypothetical protein
VERGADVLGLPRGRRLEVGKPGVATHQGLLVLDDGLGDRVGNRLGSAALVMSTVGKPTASTG